MPRIRKHLVWGILAAAIAASTADPLGAQNITVQQPVIESFTVDTTVSVPDRGRATIGGIGRGASSRTTYGPFRTNTNFGRLTEGSSVSVHAWIHDFDELDRQSLEAARRSKLRGDDVRLEPRAELAFQRLLEQGATEPVLASRPEQARRPEVPEASPEKNHRPKPAAPRAEESTPTADDYFARGLKARAAGKRGVALVYLRLARDHGSRQAIGELQRLDSPNKARLTNPD
ncbi:MAG: hypothetical protein EXS05_17105 [Planctomycetaceae bacterium]|nr:hypothetical protein [Planctomycetaceae bacterium]